MYFLSVCLFLAEHSPTEIFMALYSFCRSCLLKQNLLNYSGRLGLQMRVNCSIISLPSMLLNPLLPEWLWQQRFCSCSSLVC